MRAASKTFPLKDGQCVLYQDKMVLEYQGIRGRWLAWANKRKLTSVGFWYVMAGMGFLVAAIFAAIIDNWFLAFFFMLFVALCIAASWMNRQASLRTTILKKDITSVQFHKAVQGESRAYFRVYFQPGSKVRMRKLPLPGRHQQGSQIANSALWMLKEEGLMS